MYLNDIPKHPVRSLGKLSISKHADRAYTISMSKTLEQPAATSAVGPRFFIYAGIWFAVFNWGASFVAARFLLHPASAGLVALSPTLLAALRFSIASIFFLVP